MVRAMRDEMEPCDLSERETIYAIALGLVEGRGIQLLLPFGWSDALLAESFVSALLEVGVGHPVPEA